MANPTYDWEKINSGEVDADSPLSENLFRKIEKELIHIKEVLYDTGFPRKGHRHDGTGSSTISLLPDAVSTASINTGAVTQDKLEDYQAGAIVLAESLAEEYSSPTSYVKIKEIQINRGGSLRMTFQMRSGVGTWTASARIYRNGVWTGYQVNTTSYYYEYKTFPNIPGWSYGDLVQLYVASPHTYFGMYVKGFRIRTHILTRPLVIL